jgi:hypothetical protein
MVQAWVLMARFCCITPRRLSCVFQSMPGFDLKCKARVTLKGVLEWWGWRGTEE